MIDHDRKIAVQNAIRQAWQAWSDLLTPTIPEREQRYRTIDRGLAAMLTAGWLPPTQPPIRERQ